MKIKFIIIILGEPNSVFSEIIGKYFTKVKNHKKKIILIGNINLLKKQLLKLKYNLKLNQITKTEDAKINSINIININYKFKKTFSKISSESSNYIEKSFNKSIEILKFNKKNCVLINGPISKKTFLKRRYQGITEYLSDKTNSNDEAMLIYNNKMSVSPITTHIPIKYVSKKINKKKIINNVIKINYFYKNNLKRKVKFAILGLNPHCETIDKISEEENIIKPSIKYLKKMKFDVQGPFSADTFFIKKNLDKFDVVIGMYHDQVLTPIKTLFNFKAINITVGLPFIRISPDHGPNAEMIGKNKSDPSSFFYAMNFIDKLK